MYEGKWQRNGNQISTTLHGLQLTVLRLERCVRYIIRETPDDGGSGSGHMLASGTKDDLDSAINAARNTARRVRSVLIERRRERASGHRCRPPAGGMEGNGYMRKYVPLLRYLRRQPAAELVLSFEQIEEIVGGSLPASAYSASWWCSEKLGFWAPNARPQAASQPAIVASLLPGGGGVRFRRTRGEPTLEDAHRPA